MHCVANKKHTLPLVSIVHTPLGEGGGGGLSHFSEGLYRRDLAQIGIKLVFWVGIDTLDGGGFFQVGLENSLHKK